MLAGIATYIKLVRPGVKVIGVEAADAAGMTASLEANKVVTLDQVGNFADGAAVKTVGSETFRLCQMHVDEMVTVSTDEICAAIKAGFNDTRCVLEPAGALAIAGMKKYLAMHGVTGRTVVATTSGANMDFNRLRFVSERADSSETLLSVRIPEKPGAFRKLYKLISPRNVTEFSYRYHTARHADVIISFQAIGDVLERGQDAAYMISTLRDAGYAVADLNEDEFGKAHLRYLVGGRPPIGSNLDERLYRFNFPETPGCLGHFLKALNRGWNVTLFHYRNHGENIGKVLVGIDVSESDEEKFQAFLEDLGYEWFDETSNESYAQFLRNPKAW